MNIDINARTEKTLVTKADIKEGLARLGLQAGANVGVHSSLKSFGLVEGGPDAVIDAILETIGSEGNVVMPAYSKNRRDVQLSQEDRDQGVQYIFEILPFDKKKEPAWTGIISDTFWRRPSAIRGNHVSFSLAAIGPKAETLCGGWRKLLDEDGDVLLLGVTLGCCSAMHLVEDSVKLPDHIARRLAPLPSLDERRRKGEIDFDMGPYPDFELMEQPCREAGIMREGRIGKADVKLLRLKKLLELYREHLCREPDKFYRD